MANVTCSSCSVVNPERSMFCLHCGSPVTPAPGAAASGVSDSANPSSLQEQIFGAQRALNRLTDRVIRLELAGTASPAAPAPAAQPRLAAPPRPVVPDDSQRFRRPAVAQTVYPPVTPVAPRAVPAQPAYPQVRSSEQAPAEESASRAALSAAEAFAAAGMPVPAWSAAGGGFRAAGGEDAARRLPPEAAADADGRVPAGPRGPAWLDRLQDFEINWERVLGRNWFAIIGAVALAVGIGFFLRLAFHNKWIGETGQVMLGIGAGAALLGAGEWTARRYGMWSRAVTGGGLTVLYLSVYSAFGFYDPPLLDPLPAFIFLGATVLVSGLLALRYQSLTIALMAIGGAFLTPVLLGRKLDADERWMVMVYILVVDSGILGIATFRNWRWVTLLGLAASYGLLGGWITQVADRDLIGAQLGLSGMFLIFAGATTLFHIVWRRAPKPQDMTLMTINALAFFGITYGLLWDKYEAWFGLITLSLSSFYGLVGYGALRRSGAPPVVALYALASALIFLTAAVPLQLSGEWITVAWVAEGAVLVWLGFTVGEWKTRAVGLAIMALGTGRLLIFDTPIDLDGFTVVVNERFPAFVAAVAAAYVTAWVYRRNRAHMKVWETDLPLIFVGAASFLTLWGVSAELITLFDYRSVNATGQVLQDQLNLKLVSLTAAWTLYATGLIAIGVRMKKEIVQWVGIGLLGVAAAKLLFVDTLAVQLGSSGFLLAVNAYFLTAALVVLAVIAAAIFLRRGSEASGRVPLLYVGLLAAANVILLWSMSFEAVHFFDAREGRALLAANSVLASQVQDAQNGLHLSLTALWAVYSAGLLAVGWWKKSPELSRSGGALLAAAVAKVVFVDTSVVSFDAASFDAVLNFRFLTGAIVLATATLAAVAYRRMRHAMPSWEQAGAAWLPAAANGVALWLLSAELFYHFGADETRALLAGGAGVSGKLQSAQNGLYLSLTALWAVYAAVLLLVGQWKRWPWVLRSGVVLLAVAAFKSVVVDTALVSLNARTFAPVANFQFLTGAMVLAGTVLAAWYYQRNRERLAEWEKMAPTVLAVAANFIALWLLSAEVVRFFAAAEARAMVTGGAAVSAKLQSAQNGVYLSLTALWAIYATVLMLAGQLKRWPWVVRSGVALLAVAAFKYVVVDTTQVSLSARTFVPVANVQFLAGALVLAGAVLAACFYQRRRERLADWEKLAPAVLAAAANFIALWLLSAEVVRFFDARGSVVSRDLESAMHMTLTLLWAVYAIGAIAAGGVMRSARVRQAGVAFLALPVAKLFAFDVFQLEPAYRVAAFVTLGLLLLATGFAYQRYSREIKGFILGQAR